ncbi:helix-turn-helix domain-containing protein [Peribacillus simplex]|uniref:helix-turn-helix domain-containing protein n=1 Tax=Peribacillus simplex TaxID=1478 RepID=UPI003D281549
MYIFGKWFLTEQRYEPSSEEKVILSELVQKTVESEDYKKIAEKENIIAIDTSIDKNKGGVFPYYYFTVSVRTDKQTYLFSCNNDQCSKMENEEWTYSIYQDESPRLPFKKYRKAKKICSIPYLSKLENNKIDPSEDNLIQLLKRLDIDIEIEKVQSEYKELIHILYQRYPSIRFLQKESEKLPDQNATAGSLVTE